MDGPWQVGHKTAYEYGRLANETAKTYRKFDEDLELIVCGSSNDKMATYPEWEAEVLDQSYESINYISLHKYWNNYPKDTSTTLPVTMNWMNTLAPSAASSSTSRPRNEQRMMSTSASTNGTHGITPTRGTTNS